MAENSQIKSSFRDPSGFVFNNYGVVYRYVNNSYRTNYDYLLQSGLYESLINQGLLIPHSEIDVSNGKYDEIKRIYPGAYKFLLPKFVPFISYPYEWCFSQLKNAALTTLNIQEAALQVGMSLKDASAFNVQFVNDKAIFIDTLSFEVIDEGSPWIAYQQFCRHFLAPLTLMATVDVRLNQLSCIHIDGIPLDLASKLLPKKTWLNFHTLFHIHLHAIWIKKFSANNRTIPIKKINKISMLSIIDSLKSAISILEWKPRRTEWSDYYDHTNYEIEALVDKKNIISQHLDSLRPKAIWDFGANTGLFSRLASARGIHTISFDVDHLAVERNYQKVVDDREKFILPLFLDLMNPTSSKGWSNDERMSLTDRGPVDVIMALALIHHLAISGNLPFKKIAHFLSILCQHLIIEFIPKSDRNVQTLLVSREDIFTEYNEDNFELAFKEFFSIISMQKIKKSDRNIYLMRKLP